jgi:hypothetical protein
MYPITNVSNANFSVGPSPTDFFQLPEFHEPCLAISNLWKSISQESLFTPLVSCDQTTCAIPRVNPYVWITHSSNNTGCNFSVSSSTIGAQINSNKLGTETTTNVLFDGHESKYVVDPENKKLHVQWKIDPQDSSGAGEFKISLNPATNKFDILFKNGMEDISGECSIGQKNFLTCTAAQNGIFSKLFSGSITADIEEQLSPSGVKQYILSILHHSPLPFSSSREIGYAHYSFDEKSRSTVFSGVVISPDGTPLVNASFSYETNKENEPTSNFSFNGLGQEILHSVEPNRFNFKQNMNDGPIAISSLFYGVRDKAKEHYSATYEGKISTQCLDSELMLNMNATLQKSFQNASINLLETNNSSLLCPSLTYLDSSYSAQGNFSHKEDFNADIYQAEGSDNNGYEFATKYRQPKN